MRCPREIKLPKGMTTTELNDWYTNVQKSGWFIYHLSDNSAVISFKNRPGTGEMVPWPNVMRRIQVKTPLYV